LDGSVEPKNHLKLTARDGAQVPLPCGWPRRPMPEKIRNIRPA